jgi:hypothetical protein
MRTLGVVLLLIFASLLFPSVTFAVTSNLQVTQFTSQLLGTFTILGSLVATFFIIKGGYLYITSAGKPDALEDAKKTIRNALIGLVLILSANTFVSVLSGSFTNPSLSSNTTSLQFAPIEPVETNGGLTQVLMEAIGSLLQNVVQSATKPITDAIISFLTTTPALSTNSVVFNFWLIIIGIVDALFALVIAILGFQFMSASTFGFEELELKKLLPRIGLAFLGANMSIFIIDTVIQLSNSLVTAILSATGGLNQAWITSAFNPASLDLDQIAFITLIFMILFVILAAVLLLFYITRLITIAVGAVLSPFIFLLWALPRFADFAEMAAKSYLVTIFSLFVHVVVIQLAASFLTLPGQVGNNSLISILVGIGLLFTLLKTQSFMIQLMFYNSGRAMMKRMAGQIMNVISSKQAENGALASARTVKVARKIVNA